MSVNIILDDENIRWEVSSQALVNFRRMWIEGKSLMEIAKVMNRTQLEVSLIIMDQSLKGNIKPRKHGIFG